MLIPTKFPLSRLISYVVMEINISFWRKCHEIKKDCHIAVFFAVRTGLEPVTSCVTGRHSNQLN